VIGGELREAERVVHLSAFPGHEPSAGQGGRAEFLAPPIAPPSRRRRRE
jgi:hypothetical protein